MEALGWVVDEGRGSLPFALLHGESLIACASWALGDSGVTIVDLKTTWLGLQDADEPVVLHDVLCPLTPASFIESCVEQAVESDRIVVGFRPVTDTVKVLHDGFVGETVDRASLRSITSPVVLPARVVAALEDLPSTDFATLVTALAQQFEIEYVEAPPLARRVTTLDELKVLEALSESSR